MNNNKAEQNSILNQRFMPIQSSKDPFIPQSLGASSSGGPDPSKPFVSGISSGGGFLPQYPHHFATTGSGTHGGDINLISNPQSLTLSEAIRWEHSDGQPQLLMGSLYYRRPSPAQQWEVDREALAVLEVLGRQTVEGWKGAPGSQNCVFDHVELWKIHDFKTESDKDEWKGTRHWQATGTPLGYLYYRMM